MISRIMVARFHRGTESIMAYAHAVRASLGLDLHEVGNLLVLTNFLVSPHDWRLPSTPHYCRMLLMRHYYQRPFDKTVCDAIIANGGVKNRQKRCKTFAMTDA